MNPARSTLEGTPALSDNRFEPCLFGHVRAAKHEDSFLWRTSMLRRTLIGFLFVAVFALFSATRAKADDVFTWTLPSSPTIPSTGVTPGCCFMIMNVPLFENGAPLGDYVFDFYTSANDVGGGFDAFSMGQSAILNEFGPQVYTGPTGMEESNPTFLLGSFGPFTGDGSATVGMMGTLDISSIPGDGDLFTYTLSSTPEPGSLLLLGTGLLCFLGLAWKRRIAAQSIS
jgi:PEP-CTERM motif